MANETQFDLEKTQDLFELFQTPQDQRDQDWIEDFLEVVPQASLRSFDEQLRRGPDGFPYLFLSLPDSGEDFDAFSVSDSTEYCLKNGCGIVLFKDSKNLDHPEWVFTFGSLWSYKEYGNFIGDPTDEPQQTPEHEPVPGAEPREIMVGIPTEDYLPSFARKAIARFLKDTIGLEQARVALVVDPSMKPTRALMFADLQPERFEQKDHFTHFMSALRWFLPTTRGLMAGVPQISEHAVPLV